MATPKLLLAIHGGGRALLWRLGRKLYCWARGDLANNPEQNGEYWLLNEVAKVLPSQALLLDVGANKGEWSLRALSLAERAGKQVAIVAFEPCAATRSLLADRLSGFSNVEVFALALSSIDGEAEFFSSGAGAGTNSLYAVSGSTSERVQLITLDSFVDRLGIDRICMLKIDAEGHDLDVLKGAEQMLTQGRIDLVQFEYNWRWIISHAALRDVFEYIKDKPYRLGKLVRNGIDVFDEWHFEMDRYFENNYVLIRDDSSLLNISNLVHFDKSNCARRFGIPSGCQETHTISPA